MKLRQKPVGGRKLSNQVWDLSYHNYSQLTNFYEQEEINKRLSLPADLKLPDNFITRQTASPTLEGPITRYEKDAFSYPHLIVNWRPGKNAGHVLWGWRKKKQFRSNGYLHLVTVDAIPLCAWRTAPNQIPNLLSDFAHLPPILLSSALFEDITPSATSNSKSLYLSVMNSWST